jgi:hypothetical protein
LLDFLLDLGHKTLSGELLQSIGKCEKFQEVGALKT